MSLQNLKSKITSARDQVAELAADHRVEGGVRRRMNAVHNDIAAALRHLADVHDDLFELQEQNQQLRKDLADRVCSRQCTRGFRTAS
jgi:3-methyladenine DNA glycosylase/8-oxoguanine DNA glycosylase